jgi:hypothetical protein
VQVSLKSGKTLWLLIHLEVQSQAEPSFEKRMFTYCLRIFDQFGQMPTSLAILCDKSQTWRPYQHTQLPELGSPHLSSGGGKATKRLQPL